MTRNIIIIGWVTVVVLALGLGMYGNWDRDQRRINHQFQDCQRDWLQSQIPELVQCRNAPDYTCTLNAGEYARYVNERQRATVQCMNIELETK